MLTGVTPDMRIMREEIFGPVIPIVDGRRRGRGDQRSPTTRAFGLGASVWTGDKDRGQRIARRVQSGMVWINDHMYSHGAMQTPWGGVKESGLGRAHSHIRLPRVRQREADRLGPGAREELLVAPLRRVAGAALNSAASLLWGRDADKLTALKRGAKPFAGVVRKTLKRNV